MKPPRLPASFEFRFLRWACELSPRTQRRLFGAPPTIEGQTLACEVHVMIEMARRSGTRSYTNLLPPAEARAANARGAAATVPKRPLPMARVENLTIPTAAGPLGARFYLPRHLPGGTPPPLLVFYHGGGWVIGSLETHDGVCRFLAQAAGVAVLSVDYRLSPEHPFPAAIDDCVTAVRWVRENAARFRGDASRLAVGGDSAGGNLSAAVSIDLRGEIAFRAAVLIYGAFDLEASVRDYEVYTPTGGDPVLPKPMMQAMMDAYLSGGARTADPRVSPQFGDLSQFPPSILLCGDADPLYGDTLHFHDALLRAGRESELHVFHGMPHAFMQLTVAEADAAVAAGAEFLRRHLAD